jgi:hypothetical protein
VSVPIPDLHWHKRPNWAEIHGQLEANATHTGTTVESRSLTLARRGCLDPDRRRPSHGRWRGGGASPPDRTVPVPGESRVRYYCDYRMPTSEYAAYAGHQAHGPRTYVGRLMGRAGGPGPDREEPKHEILGCQRRREPNRRPLLYEAGSEVRWNLPRNPHSRGTILLSARRAAAFEQCSHCSGRGRGLPVSPTQWRVRHGLVLRPGRRHWQLEPRKTPPRVAGPGP